jgi:NADH pyrophosphatase NudC (nudix superfamily)
MPSIVNAPSPTSVRVAPTPEAPFEYVEAGSAATVAYFAASLKFCPRNAASTYAVVASLVELSAGACVVAVEEPSEAPVIVGEVAKTLLPVPVAPVAVTPPIEMLVPNVCSADQVFAFPRLSPTVLAVAPVYEPEKVRVHQLQLMQQVSHQEKHLKL